MFVDYNQNAKDRTVASAYSIRPKPDARVSAPLGWDEVDDVEPADFTLASMPARFASVGDRHADIDNHPCSLEALLELSARHEKEGMGDAPWPPQYKKAPGEPPRVQPSRRRQPVSKVPRFQSSKVPEFQGSQGPGSPIAATQVRSTDREAHVEAPTPRDRTRPEERRSARRSGAMEGTLSRRGIASRTVGCVGRRHARPVYDLDANPRQPPARARGATPVPGSPGPRRCAGRL